MDKKGYTGKINNAGSQHVPAPIKGNRKGNGSVKKGADLRTK